MNLTRRTFLSLAGLAVLNLGLPWRSLAASNDSYQVAVYFWPNWHTEEAYRPRGWPKEVETGQFGEWGVLKLATARFKGHAQPKVPAWGYEDEADPRVMARKIDAAADHGVDVFIFDWYFISQGPYLARALDDGYLKAKNKDRVKFALMWAADNKLRAAGATPREVFDRLVAHVIEDYMSQPSYWKIDGKPYFSVYQIDTVVEALGGLEATGQAFAHFRQVAKARGLAGIHLNLVDAKLSKRPDAAALVKAIGADSVTSYVWTQPTPLKDFPETDYAAVQTQYFKYCVSAATNYSVPYYPNVTMGWDPTPRIVPGQSYQPGGYPNTSVLKNNTPANFKAALRQARDFVDQQPGQPKIVTVYAWNEWTEGGYLEPDTVHGLGYLKAIQEVFR